MSADDFQELEQESSRNFWIWVVGLSLIGLAVLGYIADLHKEINSFNTQMERKDKMYIGIISNKDEQIDRLQKMCSEKDFRDYVKGKK